MFLIASGDLPKIQHEEQASKGCLSFIKDCTVGEGEARSSAKDLLKHPFLESACDASVMATLLERTYALEAAQEAEEGEEEEEEGEEEGEGAGDEEESSSQAVQVSTPQQPAEPAQPVQPVQPVQSTQQIPSPPPSQQQQDSTVNHGTVTINHVNGVSITPPSPTSSTSVGSGRRLGSSHEGKAELEEETEEVDGPIVVNARRLTARPLVGRIVSPPMSP